MRRIAMLLLASAALCSTACDRVDAEGPPSTEKTPSKDDTSTKAETVDEKKPPKKKDALPRAYQRGPGVDALPKPKPGDWLAEHRESGQTYAQWVKFDQRNDPTPQKRTIYLQPIGQFDAKSAPDLEELRQFTAAFFQLPVVVQKPVLIDDKEYRSRKSRGFGRQLLTDDILDDLRDNLPDDAFCMLGITMYDLYPEPAWNFVFGQASFQERVGVFSFVRHAAVDPKTPEEGNRLTMLRNYKTLSHEIGHMFGIKHCKAYHCGMNGSNGQWESDAAPLHYCPVCLRKLQHAVRFDPAERYEKLEEKLESSHPEQAKWYRERRAWISMP